MSELTTASLIESKSMGVITLEKLKAYADASGDQNPIHQDENVARAMGLPGVIAHGMYISALVHERAHQSLSEKEELAGLKLVSSKTRFKAMTLLGDEIFIGGQWQMMGHGEAKLELSAKNQRDETTVTAVLLLRT